MICQFSFKNFMSYKNEVAFDLQAATLPEFADSVIKFEKASSLLPVSVIYGPNGGGKTNLLNALSNEANKRTWNYSRGNDIPKRYPLCSI